MCRSCSATDLLSFQHYNVGSTPLQCGVQHDDTMQYQSELLTSSRSSQMSNSNKNELIVLGDKGAQAKKEWRRLIPLKL